VHGLLHTIFLEDEIMLRSNEPIALPLHLAVDYDDALGIDTDQGVADMGSFIIPYRCEVFVAGVVVTETCSGGTTTPVVDFDLRPTAGDDTNRGAADIAHFVLSTTAAGKVMYDEAAKGTILEPGQEVVVELKVAATGSPKTGHVKPFLLVSYIPETFANLEDMTETA
jgi:hypothetical protein